MSAAEKCEACAKKTKRIRQLEHERNWTRVEHLQALGELSRKVEVATLKKQISDLRMLVAVVAKQHAGEAEGYCVCHLCRAFRGEDV